MNFIFENHKVSSDFILLIRVFSVIAMYVVRRVLLVIVEYVAKGNADWS